MGFFLARNMHFGNCQLTYCAYTGRLFCSKIARSETYLHTCTKCGIILHACITAKKCRPHFVMAKKYKFSWTKLYGLQVYWFAGVCATVFHPNFGAAQVCLLFNQICYPFVPSILSKKMSNL